MCRLWPTSQRADSSDGICSFAALSTSDGAVTSLSKSAAMIVVCWRRAGASRKTESERSRPACRPSWISTFRRYPGR